MTTALLVAMLVGLFGRAAIAVDLSTPDHRADHDRRHGSRSCGRLRLDRRLVLCGEVAKESSLTGEAAFIIEYPGEGNITTIAFGSNQLVANVTKANKFRLSVGVINAKGGQPPLFVLNTDSGQKGNSGVATLIKGKTGVTLQVVGENDMGETINLTVTCS